MFSHYITYGRISEEIRNDLEGAFISNIFSTGKDELIIETRSKHSSHQLVMQWMEQEMFIRYNMPHRKFGRKCLPWFKGSENLSIVSVQSIPFERIIHIKLEHGKSILLKGFGRYSNILFYEDDICANVFKQNLKSDIGEHLNQYLTKEIEDRVITNENEFKIAYPQLFGNWETPIPDGFYSIKASKKLQIKNIFNELSKKYLNLDQGKLCLTDEKTDTQYIVSEYLKRTRQAKQAQQFKNTIKQKRKRFLAYSKKSKKELDQLKNAKGYKELGDLILSNLHIIKPGEAIIKVWDYYDNSELEIKLNPLLNAQQNAQRFYRKGKNQHLQIEEIKRKIKTAEQGIIESDQKLLDLEKGKTIKIEKKPAKKEQNASPYRLVNTEAFDIWVGKNAKGNDAMIKLARKRDTWMHARGFAGSHVIIRNNGAPIKNELLKAAGLYAVLNSKAKSQVLVPVIYTECKFVSKPRNALPGLVKVMQENVIDISNELG
ncbi:NFACT RNA binding domain-containing protein [Bacteroidia bacterium]|nr:NFACT RNA binding domain-containing protein [Bacteroidia bacterium]